jgi:outer membrane lipoprotein
MKRILFTVFSVLFLVSCAPVLKEEVIRTGDPSVSIPEIIANPAVHKGKVYIFGGEVIETRRTALGDTIEAFYIPVDSRGYLKESERTRTRFLAFLPSSAGNLDPEILDRRYNITVAGEFRELQPGRINGAEYFFPVFEIRDLYVWAGESPVLKYSPYQSELKKYREMSVNPPWGDSQRPAWR